jgi:hypothetical protein
VPRAPGCLPLGKGKGGYFRSCDASDLLWDDWLRSISASLLLLEAICRYHSVLRTFEVFEDGGVGGRGRVRGRG